MAELYRDVNIIEAVRLTPDGKVQKVYRVSAVSKSGTSFTLEMAEADFTQAKVKKALDEKAQLIESIRSF